MATKDRKRSRVGSDDGGSSPSAKRSTTAKDETSDDATIDAELSSINDLLQEEETSQKQTWQIGKRVKKLLESHEKTLPIAKQLDAYFLWGTALARLASLNEDPTLADAAADKFQQMLQLSQDTDDEDAADAALGPVGFSLWGSSLLIVATETQSREVLDEALAKFQRAVEVDGGTTFETRFQSAKALKEGGDLVEFLEEGSDAKTDYYDRALQECRKLEEIYKVESEKENSVEKKSGHDSDEEEDEDDDTVTAEDFAEAKLLEAVIQGLLEDASSVEDFHRTIALYQKAISLNPGSAEALMEMTNYLAARCLARTRLAATPTVEEWTKLFDDLESQYKSLLTDAGFDLQECHEICHRKDTNDQEEPEEEEIDERVPHLLNTLGKGLAAFVRSFPQENGADEGKKQQKQKRKKSSGGPRFTHAVEVLRSAHHFHDKLGGYYLACLYASRAFEDEEQCRTWLETADSYGALEDEFDVQEFTTMHEKAWFKRLAQPPVQIEEIDGEHPDEEEKEEDEGDEE